MSQLRCPICRQLFEPEKSPALPFCSPRCKQIDLARWLDERYRLPREPPDDAAEELRRHDEEDVE